LSNTDKNPGPDESDGNAWIGPADGGVLDGTLEAELDGLHARRPGHPWERARARRHSRPGVAPTQTKILVPVDRTAMPGSGPRPGASWTGRGRQRTEEQRLNSSHVIISYAVFCLKKKTAGPAT